MNPANNISWWIATKIRKGSSPVFSTMVVRIGIASIALGIAVILIAFAVLFGFKSAIQEKLFSLSPHIKIQRISANDSYEEPAMPLKNRVMTSYKTIENIKHIQAVAHKSGILKTKEALQGVVLKGVGKDFDWKLFRNNIIAGKALTFNDSTAINQLLISKKIAQMLRLKPNDTVLMYFLQNPPRVRKLKVVGIYETYLEEFDNQLVMANIALVQRLNAWGKDTVGSMEIYLKNFDNLDQSSRKIKALMPPEMHLERVDERFIGVFDWLNLLDQNLLIFLVIIALVACFNMVSVLLVMIMERIPMIGVLKAVGATDSQIRRIFVFQGIYIVAYGLLWGNIIGGFLCGVQYLFKIIRLNPENYYMDTVPIEWHWHILVFANIAVLILVGLVLLLPTAIINRITPVKAIAFRK